MSQRSLLIGSLELKRAYQKNMAIGFGVSAGVHLLAIGLILLVMFITSDNKIVAPQIVIKSKADLILPPSLSQQKEQIKVATPEHQIKPSVGILEAVPDEEAPEEVEIATQDELAEMAPAMPVEDLEDLGVDMDLQGILDELLPQPDQFVPFEEAPVQVNQVQPVYPPLAQRAGIEGSVWINVLVDKDGKVRDVIVVKDSGANAGFEEAAVEAAYNTVWKPAIANGQPIAVWATYKVEFKLKG
ncbi:MAG: TonB family protein [candidate division Zixibacteria bacterium]